MNKKVLEDIPSGEYSMVETDLFPDYAKMGLLSSFTYNFYWLDIGTIERYERAQEDIKKFF
jgi:NDP-sugar pyrophosphorylase family protein